MIIRPMMGSASGKAYPDAEGIEDDGEAGQPIGTGVIALRDQGDAVHLAPGSDAEHRHNLIPDEADEARDC